MKKLLFVLLASAAISPAMAQTYKYVPAQRTNQPIVLTQGVQGQPIQGQNTQQQVRRVKKHPTYKLGNPLYRPAAQKGVVSGDIRYTRTPKNNTIAQRASGSWDVIPAISFGLTDKLVVNASAGYNRKEIKSAPNKGAKISSYRTQVGVSYQFASVDGFDFNGGIGAYYEYVRDSKMAELPSKTGRVSGTDVNLQIGKKIENVTPFFTIGFLSDFWSKRGYQTGTNTYINPGVYIDLHEQVGLKLDYTSVVHAASTYRAVLDFYPQNNIVLGLGAFIVHPQTDTNNYGALVNFKFGF